MPHYKNFDALRLIAASSVIFSHSFLIADGHEHNEPFVGPLGHILGVYGVFIFFILSGLLVTQSMVSSKSVPLFFSKRCARIFPGLLVCVVLTTGLAIAFFYNGSIAQFATEHALETFQTFAFVRDGIYYNNLELYPSPNYIGTIINGSLWTIRQELICYVAVGVFFWLRILNIRMAIMMLSVFLAMHYWGVWGFNKFTGGLIFLAPSFLAGMMIYFVLKRHRPSGWMAIACLVLFGVSAYFKLLDYTFPLLGAYLIGYLGTSAPFNLGNAARFGDLSYGTYLYGWPIEQSVRYYLGDAAHWWAVFCISLPLALALGFVSWHLIEKRALRLAGAGGRIEWWRRSRQWDSPDLLSPVLEIPNAAERPTGVSHTA